jgi:hypothetical protein
MNTNATRIRRSVVACLALALVQGCWLGDRLGSASTVVLAFAPPVEKQQGQIYIFNIFTGPVSVHWGRT